MSDIQRYDYDKAWGMGKHELGDYVQYDDHAAIVAQLEADKSNAEYCFRELKKINEKLEADLAAYQEREQWIHDNATTSGGGNGFTVTFFVPVDHEDIFCGISAAIKGQGK